MRFLLFLYVFILPGCQQKSTRYAGPVRTEAALIYENGLAYDGCSERIELLADSSVYVPTANTLPILQKALASLPRSSSGQSRAVTIRFIETGQQGTLACGWGAQSKVSEMDVLDITKR